MSHKTVNFETACEVLSIPTALPIVNGLPETYQKEMVDNYQIQVIADAINKENDGWKPNWEDHNQWKCLPWFHIPRPGVGWAYDGYDVRNALADCGSRLFFENGNDAEYFGKLILELGFTI